MTRISPDPSMSPACHTCYDCCHQAAGGHPRLHLGRGHGRDDLLWPPRPQGGVRLRAGGVQGAQGLLGNHPHPTLIAQVNRRTEMKIDTWISRYVDVHCAWLSSLDFHLYFEYSIFFVCPVLLLLYFTQIILLSTIFRRSAGIPDFLTADDMLGKYL